MSLLSTEHLNRKGDEIKVTLFSVKNNLPVIKLTALIPFDVDETFVKWLYFAFQNISLSNFY